MPTLVFHDDTTKRVPYAIAVEIREILNGKKEPKNKKQEEFVTKVKEIRTDLPRPIAQGTGRRGQLTLEQKLERRKKCKTIMEDTNLSGIEKMRAIKDVLVASQVSEVKNA